MFRSKLIRIIQAMLDVIDDDGLIDVFCSLAASYAPGSIEEYDNLILACTILFTLENDELDELKAFGDLLRQQRN